MKVENLQKEPEYMMAVAKIIHHEFVEKTRSTATIEDIIRYLSQPNEKQLPYTLMAVESGNCVGTVSIFEQDIKERPEYSPCLASLCVQSNYRGQGIGTKLIQEVLEIAKSLGYHKIFLKTETARKFYENLGWTYLETIVDEFNEESYIFKMCLN